jgi:hypothetical protein
MGSKPRGRKRNYVLVKNKSYGKNLWGTRIFFEGPKPKGLTKDGTIKFGKNILEILKARFPKFHWIITTETDRITLERGIYRIRTSVSLLNRLNSRLFSRTRDIKNDLIRHTFSVAYSDFFSTEDTAVYVAGTIANILNKEMIPRMSSEDKEAMLSVLPTFIASESIASVNLLKAEAQIRSLKELAADLETCLLAGKSESWWQTYIKGKILIIQQGYIQAVEKLNVALGETKFPDFSLITHDSYLDILEIKKPSTTLLKKDDSRGNFYWDAEISKAIIQTENYIANVTKHADSIRTYLFDKFKITLKILRPRGIILAGDRRTFKDPKEHDDFRLLSQSCKNVTILTYDELLIRLKNYIEALEEHRVQPDGKSKQTPPVQ